MKYPLDPKDCQVRRVTTDTLVHEGPCLLVSFITSGETTARWVKLRDGLNTSADILVEMQSASKASCVFCPQVPIVFHQGLYVDCENSILSAVVQYAPIQQGE